MRTILFRGRTTYGSIRWIYGYYQNNGSIPYILDKQSNMLYNVDYVTIGEYTDLKDKNGIKIFEGDIVNILTKNKKNSFINYKDGCFVVDTFDSELTFYKDINSENVEIIGNIYDNPEILEDK